MQHKSKRLERSWNVFVWICLITTKVKETRQKCAQSWLRILAIMQLCLGSNVWWRRPWARATQLGSIVVSAMSVYALVWLRPLLVLLNALNFTQLDSLSSKLVSCCTAVACRDKQKLWKRAQKRLKKFKQGKLEVWFSRKYFN